MKGIRNILSRIGRIKALKYIVVSAIAVVLIGFVDENSVWGHLRNKQRISELQHDIKQYTDQHRYNQARIREIDSDPKAMEKIARERYFMKTDDEDIFVLSDDQPQPTPTAYETAD